MSDCFGVNLAATHCSFLLFDVFFGFLIFGNFMLKFTSKEMGKVCFWFVVQTIVGLRSWNSAVHDSTVQYSRVELEVSRSFKGLFGSWQEKKLYVRCLTDSNSPKFSLALSSSIMIYDYHHNNSTCRNYFVITPVSTLLWIPKFIIMFKNRFFCPCN